MAIVENKTFLFETTYHIDKLIKLALTICNIFSYANGTDLLTFIISFFIKHKKILNWKWAKLSFNKNKKSWFTWYVKVLSRYSCHVNFRQRFLNIFLKITNFWNKLLWSFCIFVSGLHVVGVITKAFMANEKCCKTFYESYMFIISFLDK